MADRSEFIHNVKFRTKLLELLIVKLSIIVGDDGIRQSKSAYDRLLNEVFHLFFSDLRQGFGFHLLGEIIYRDD